MDNLYDNKLKLDKEFVIFKTKTYKEDKTYEELSIESKIIPKVFVKKCNKFKVYSCIKNCKQIEDYELKYYKIHIKVGNYMKWNKVKEKKRIIIWEYKYTYKVNILPTKKELLDL